MCAVFSVASRRVSAMALFRAWELTARVAENFGDVGSCILVVDQNAAF